MRYPVARKLTRTTAKGVLAATSRWWRRALVARAVDASGLMSGRRLMILAPHPDDETLGCGALIARARAAGDPVTVVVATDGRHSTRSAVLSPAALARVRADELRLACRGLGVPAADLVILGWEDGSLAARLPQLTSRFADHRAVYRAAVRAVDAQPASCLLVGYPVWTWAHAPWFVDAAAPHGWRGRLGRLGRLGWSAYQLLVGGWIRVGCGPYLGAKRTAVQAYASQTTNLTGEPSWRHLSPEFVSLFLQPAEVFRPVPAGRRLGA
jgi:LmbE family N-acetylglucosaminyl deacetylase